MKAIYRLNFDCGRNGSLQGIFVSEQDRIRTLIDHKIEVYFGEVLGKHSEVFGPMDEGELTMVSDNQEAIKVIEDLKLENGYNPFDYTVINFNYESWKLEDSEWTVGDLCDKLIELKLTSLREIV
jgi:hypothetical protein